MGGGVTITAVQLWDHWRVRLEWPDQVPRFVGKFDTQEEAEKWIGEHHWLTEQDQVADDKI